MEKDVFRLVASVGRTKICLSPLEESNLRPLDSALRCSTTEPQRFYSERGLLRNLCMTSFSISLPNSKLIIFRILLTNMTLSTSLVLAVWMAVCHTWLMSCHVTLLTRRRAFFSEIKLFPKVSWQNHEKFSRVSLLLLSMENCRKSP